MAAIGYMFIYPLETYKPQYVTPTHHPDGVDRQVDKRVSSQV